MSNYITFEEKRFHHLWLRDNCPCLECRHPSGQRLHETWQLNADITAESVKITDDGLEISWAYPDAHQSTYSRDFLMKHSYDDSTSDNGKESTAVQWGSELSNALPTFDYNRVIVDDKEKGKWLNAVVDYGVAKLTNVPTQPGTILDIVDLFGYVRDTNYGRLFEVISEEQPVNLAYTPIPLSLHTDNPYRDPVPSLQLLHCLVKADQGGVTALADGFYAAEILREQDPAAFKLLTTLEVDFKFSSTDTLLEYRGCMIEVDSQSKVKSIRVNNRSSAPFKLPFAQMAAYYQAYQSYMAILQSSKCKVTLTLEAGDLILFDNQRVLHGREVQAMGPRHLQGCYADRDGLRSTAAMLKS